jgi:hypothetical protein
MRQLQCAMLAALVLAALLVLSPRRAHASDLRCAAPPYGDAAWNYTRLKQRFANIDEEDIDDLLEKLCKAKFEHLGRRHFHKLGISDRDFAKEGTSQLAAKVLQATRGGTQVL